MSLTKRELEAFAMEVPVLRDAVKSLALAKATEQKPWPWHVEAAAYIDKFVGDGTGPSIDHFLCQVKTAADLGLWSEQETVNVFVLRLGEPAAEYFRTIFGHTDEPSIRDIEQAFLQRFGEQHTDHYWYWKLFSVVQEEGESVVKFAERVHRLGNQTLKHSSGTAKRVIRRAGMKDRMLAAFLHGLQGELGKIVRYKFFTEWDAAVQGAIRVETEMADQLLMRDFIPATATYCVCTEGLKQRPDLSRKRKDIPDYVEAGWVRNSPSKQTNNGTMKSERSKVKSRLIQRNKNERVVEAGINAACLKRQYPKQKGCSRNTKARRVVPIATVEVGPHKQARTKRPKRVKCFYCHKFGHGVKECRWKQRDRRRKQSVTVSVSRNPRLEVGCVVPKAKNSGWGDATERGSAGTGVQSPSPNLGDASPLTMNRLQQYATGGMLWAVTETARHVRNNSGCN